MKKSYISVLFLLVGAILLFRLFTDEPVEKNKRNEVYLKYLKLELTGIVTDKKYIDHGIYRVIIDVKESNKQNYHPQDSLKYYLCKIDNNQADLILSDPSKENYTLGDSIVISSKRDSCYSYGVDRKLKHKRKLEIINYVDY